MRTLSPLVRGALCAEYCAAGGRIDTAYLRRRFNLSKAQAKRDIRALARHLHVTNTGGKDGRTTLKVIAA